MSSATQDCDYVFKILLIGDSGVGKSCLLLRFADDAFTESYITTIGVDFRFRTIQIRDKMVRLQIWDTAGQERFRTITSAYYRGADGIAIVYDTTERSSFDHVDEWRTELCKYAREDTSKMLVGNKCDLTSERNVQKEEGEAKAKEHQILFTETSAKDRTNVDLAFQLLAEELVRLRESGAQSHPDGNMGLERVRVGEETPSGSRLGNCCGGN